MIESDQNSARARSLLKRIRDQSFPDAIRDAYKRDVKMLCELISEGHPKTEEDRTALVQLLKRRVGLQKRGRPEPLPNETADMERLIVSETRKQIASWKAANGRKQMPKGEIEKIADAICEKYDDWGELWHLSISRDNILKALKRGERKPKKRPKKS